MVNNTSKSSFAQKIVIFLLTIFGVFAIGFYFFAKTLPRLPKKLDEIMLSPPTEIYDSKNKLITTLGGRKSVKIGSISPHFQNAIVAIEDARFFSHHGIDKLGILRAILKNITKNKSEGASTITQQLARNLFFTFEKRYDRKIAEAFVSFQVEQQFSKMEILENYCNLIYLGSGAYGIEYASEIYFAKSAKDLNLAEAALIAGIPKWPAKYSPYVNFEEAKKRQAVVLTRMLEEKMITQAEFDEAKNFQLKLGRLNKTAEIATYYVDFVKQEVIKILSKDYEIPVSSAEQVLYYGGLKIYTTLETELQVKAQLSIQKQITLLDEKLNFSGYTEATQQEKKQYLQAALVAIEPQTGKILAMVGGRDYYTSPFNRTVTALRQPGSGFKPFVYLTALNSGKFTPKTVINDFPISIEVSKNNVWKPKNFGGDYYGEVVLKKALMKSLNSVAAQLIVEVTPQEVLKTIQKFGFESKIEPNLSLALGTSGVTVLEMASAYGVFATEGTYAKPFAIVKIEDAFSRTLSQNVIKPEKIFEEEEIYPLLDMLQGVVDDGTATRIRSSGISCDAAGKTGTTNSSVDAWFNGFLPDLSCSVWIGFDDNSPLKPKNKKGVSLTGSSGALPIWIDFIKRANRPAKFFKIPQGIEFFEVDAETGFAPTDSTLEIIRVALKKDSLEDTEQLETEQLEEN